MLLLALYAFLNTALCNVYYYFKIEVTWYHALLTVGLVTFLTWEGNRLIKPWFKKKFLTPKTKVRYLAFFFIAGNGVALLSAIVTVIFIGHIVQDYSQAQNLNPYKLNNI